MRIVATGPSGPAEELAALAAAGHHVTIGRPLDHPSGSSSPRSHSEAGRRANLRLALDQILAVGRGEVPAHVVNPDALARWRRP